MRGERVSKRARANQSESIKSWEWWLVEWAVRTDERSECLEDWEEMDGLQQEVISCLHCLPIAYLRESMVFASALRRSQVPGGLAATRRDGSDKLLPRVAKKQEQGSRS